MRNVSENEVKSRFLVFFVGFFFVYPELYCRKIRWAQPRRNSEMEPSFTFYIWCALENIAFSFGNLRNQRPFFLLFGFQGLLSFFNNSFVLLSFCFLILGKLGSLLLVLTLLWTAWPLRSITPRFVLIVRNLLLRPQLKLLE